MARAKTVKEAIENKIKVASKKDENIIYPWPFSIVADDPSTSYYINIYAPIIFERAIDSIRDNTEDIKYLVARYIDHKTYKEIAEEFGVSKYVASREVRRSKNWFIYKLQVENKKDIARQVQASGGVILSAEDIGRALNKIEHELNYSIFRKQGERVTILLKDDLEGDTNE